MSDSEQTKVLKEILKWIKISGIKEVKSVLEEHFQDDSKKIIYQLSDGTKGTREIAKIVGTVKYVTVSNYWKIWEKIGLGESKSAIGGSRFKRSFDLEDFGIKVPEIKSKPTQTTEPTEGEDKNDI